MLSCLPPFQKTGISVRVILHPTLPRRLPFIAAPLVIILSVCRGGEKQAKTREQQKRGAVLHGPCPPGERIRRLLNHITGWGDVLDDTNICSWCFCSSSTSLGRGGCQQRASGSLRTVLPRFGPPHSVLQNGTRAEPGRHDFLRLQCPPLADD